MADVACVVAIRCRYGRRRSLIVAHIITGIALIVSAFVPPDAGKDLPSSEHIHICPTIGRTLKSEHPAPNCVIIIIIMIIIVIIIVIFKDHQKGYRNIELAMSYARVFSCRIKLLQQNRKKLRVNNLSEFISEVNLRKVLWVGLCPLFPAGLLCIWKLDHERGTVCQPNSEHQIWLCGILSVISRTAFFSSTVVYAAAGRWAQHCSTGAVVTV